MAQNDIGIDLGTTTIIIAQAGQGVVLNQPSVVAMDTRKNSVLEVGDKALAMVGRTPNYISAIFPLKDGVISDHTMTRELICRFVNQVYSSHMVKPRVAVCVPAAITGIESDAVVEAVMAAGARQVYLIDEPIAAALGSGIDITQPDGRMIIDIGGGTTDVAVISLSGVVESASIKIAGDQFNEAVIKYIRRKHNVLIGERTAEELKMSIGCVYPREEEQTMEIKGRDLMTGLPRAFTVSSSEMIEAFEEPTMRILEAVHSVLERTPPELVADISNNGIVMTGGGSLIWGIDRLIEQHTGIETHVADDAISCVAFGTGKSLEDVESMQDGTMNLSRRKQMNT